MKSKFLVVFLALLLVAAISNAQSVKGKVYTVSENKKESLNDVVIKWINTTKGTLSDANGNFELLSDGITDKRLIIIFVGYKKDTIDTENKDFVEILLKPNLVTNEIKVEGYKKSTYFENTLPKTEVLSSVELKKESSCDLSGCFGRNSSVDVQVTDLLTDSKELKLLGLEGAYTTMLVDNMPLLGGMVYKYGVSSISSTLINKIMISKGANSVFQGYESIGGNVNVILKSYEESEPLFINGYINSGFEKQFNVNYVNNFKKWNSLLSFQSVQKSNRIDQNNDLFLDNPLVTRYFVFNKWNYGMAEDKTKLYIGAKFWNEERIGGQTNFDIKTDEGSNRVYGQTVKINNADLYTRIVHEFKNKSVLKILAAGSIYDFKSYYGVTKYNGKQKDFYFNSAYEHLLSKVILLRTGVSYKYQNINEIILFTQPVSKTYAGNYLKVESVPGLFAESSYDIIKEKISVLAGVRYDYHNIHKSIVTPRILIKVEPFEKMTLFRASFGTGFRTLNLFTEYTNILASSRDIIIKEKLNPEKITNYGINLLQYFGSSYFSGSINIDFYRTEFSNKIIPDYDADYKKVIFSNLNGRAFSNVLQTDLAANISGVLDLKLSYKFIDLNYTKNGIKYEQPFNSKHRVLGTISLKPQNSFWHIDGKWQWFGKQRLPSTASNPLEYQMPEQSESYSIVGAQITKAFGNLEIYGGIDNLFDFKQQNPIIAANDPFGQYFDTSFIWGPTRGREFYFGFRFILNKNNNNE